MENKTHTPIKLHDGFPCVVYHVVEGNQTVNDQSELDDCLKKGWSREPIRMTEANVVRAKIAELKAEVCRLEALLYEEYGEKYEDGLPTDVSEKVSVPENSKRGRPRKEK